jgi:hypothetical protein
LFVTIAIPIILRRCDLNKKIPDVTDGTFHWKIHTWVQLFFFSSATLLGAGFILLNVGLINNGYAVVGGIGIALVGVIGILILVISVCTI